MNSFREVNENILKEWLNFREENLSSITCEEDKRHWIYFEELSENILRNIPKQNQKYVKKHLDQLDKNFLTIFAIGTKSIIEMDLLMECS